MPLDPHPPVADLDAPKLDRRTVIVLLTTVVLLIIFEYWGLADSFRLSSWHERVAGWLGEGYRPYFDLLPYQYWGVASLVIRVLIPFGVVAFVLREPLRDWGWKVKPRWRDVKPYALFLAAMIPIVIGVSVLASFQAKYPFYDGAVYGGWHFWGYQLLYGFQFLGGEAFFRGFLLFGLERRLGWYAIAISTIPYVMIHFGKPMPETFAAIVAGVLLGWMALRTRSFLWGVVLHWSVAITMDITVLSREIGLVEILSRIF